MTLSGLFTIPPVQLMQPHGQKSRFPGDTIRRAGRKYGNLNELTWRAPPIALAKGGDATELAQSKFEWAAQAKKALAAEPSPSASGSQRCSLQIERAIQPNLKHGNTVMVNGSVAIFSSLV